ncbi:MAG: hypothetical protein B1H03_03335 [Planctomycetales bacterium 4484_113]|nr:MAG: hypothetical protein B1H03_03335 [Planctomycetales bacterium 4484_113]
MQAGRLGAAETTLSSIRAAQWVFYQKKERYGDFTDLTSTMKLLDSRFDGKGLGPVVIDSVAYEFTVPPTETEYEVTATIPGGEGAKVGLLDSRWVSGFKEDGITYNDLGCGAS